MHRGKEDDSFVSLPQLEHVEEHSVIELENVRSDILKED